MSPVLALILKRIGIGVVLILAISALLFLGVEALPGDFAQNFLGQAATPEAVANIRRELGLDQPVMLRYLDWLGGVVIGDFGESWANGSSVSEQLGKRLANTLFLAAVAAVFAVPISVGLGVLAVFYRNRLPDRIINILSLAAISMPEFFVGYLFIFFFALQFGIGDGPPIIPDPRASVWENVQLVFLPAMTLVVVVIAHMMRMTRAAILNIMESAYVETAELKGLSMLRIIWKHAAPNAVAPIINVVALNLAYLVVGVVVVEVIFAYPGMGQYFVDAVTVRDIPVVQACGIVFAAVYIILNMLADVGAILANPRLRHPK
ncbi:ABC transporter permease [Paralimibaculum aggregatum]|uniref:ABC transporter permease n=1 Tax=Paralimibaculum aggregatum TaxID=3036245 RepID=A0ABQ6LF02_9RHOB|nr:ABC transporter permease [Limibaculum sp. NKW23]GMG81919.1 ABC transporter permease [Limibaculum sp. NKW23]